MRVAFLGTGLMGGPMAARLCRGGLAVTAWNRTRDKAEPLRALGATLADGPVEAVREADLVVTMLERGEVVEAVLFESGAHRALRPGALVVDMSSIPPELAEDHHTRLAAKTVRHLDAPVSGGTKGAEAGSLVIFVGGERTAFESALPVLELMGRPTLIGPAGCGQLAKLANQVIVAITIGAVAEGLFLGAAGGCDPALLREALDGGFAESRILELHGKRMIERNFVPGGANRTFWKDLQTIAATAERLGLELPLFQCVRAVYKALMDSGRVDLDHSSYVLVLEERNVPRRLGPGPDEGGK